MIQKRILLTSSLKRYFKKLIPAENIELTMTPDKISRVGCRVFLGPPKRITITNEINPQKNAKNTGF
jgi:hypothetical protein